MDFDLACTLELGRGGALCSFRRPSTFEGVSALVDTDILDSIVVEITKALVNRTPVLVELRDQCAPL